jgi:hypothetical protein
LTRFPTLLVGPRQSANYDIANGIFDLHTVKPEESAVNPPEQGLPRRVERGHVLIAQNASCALGKQLIHSVILRHVVVLDGV